MSSLITPEYQELLQRQHRETKWGNEKGHRHINEVLALIERTKSTSIWDFGSGRSGLKNALRPHNITVVYEYDPGLPGKDQTPAFVDLVVSCDVLEHVEPEFLPGTLRLLFNTAAKGLFLVIACRQAKAVLPDGTNAHLIVENPEWWLSTLRTYAELSHTKWVVQEVWGKVGRELRVSYVAA